MAQLEWNTYTRCYEADVEVKGVRKHLTVSAATFWQTVREVAAMDITDMSEDEAMSDSYVANCDPYLWLTTKPFGVRLTDL